MLGSHKTREMQTTQRQKGASKQKTFRKNVAIKQPAERFGVTRKKMNCYFQFKDTQIEVLTKQRLSHKKKT